MAPKKPAPPPPPPAAGGVPIAPRFKAVPPEIKWRIIRMFGLACFCTFIVMTVLYIQLLLSPGNPLEPSMARLKRIMANALRKPSLSGGSHLMTAEEVIQLPNYLETSEKAYKEKKIKYQSIFKKGTVKSSTGWMLFEKSLYYISKGRKTWYDAQNFCLSRDAHLVSIITDKEQKYISRHLKASAWIGLTDEKDEGTWEWSDGSRVTVQYWDAGSPTRLQQREEVERDCVFIKPLSGARNWNDDNCHELKQWVCKEILVTEES
ncbi:CD209 antigen-like protein C [Candoia aspera]|uniref:CD209 antigen-like protein C n=1 Tax=Candoia aspera TaxID=51853 RepID=UPI002FD7AC2D